MDVTNVKSRMVSARQSGDATEIESCRRFLLENFVDVYRAGYVNGLERDVLEELVASDDLRADENSIFEACVEWAKDRVAMAGGQGENWDKVREELGDILYRIRFPLMSLESFSKLMSSRSGALLKADERLMLVEYMMKRSGLKQLKFDHRPRPAAAGIPSYHNENVVTRYFGDAIQPSYENKENSSSKSHVSAQRNSLPFKICSKPLQARSLRNTYPPRYDYNWRSTSSLNRFLFKVDEPVDTGFIIDAIDFQTDRNIHVTALGLFAGKPTSQSPDAPNNARPVSRASQRSTNRNQGGKIGDNVDKTPPSPAREGTLAHSVVMEFFEAGHPMMGTPTRQHKSYQGHEGQPGKPVRVELREPVLVKAGARYTIVIKATGPPTYRGTNGKDEVTVGVVGNNVTVPNGDGNSSWIDGDTDARGVRFKFFKSDKDFNGTDTNTGQIPQIYFTL